MNLKEKRILLNDLACRLPFGVKITTPHGIFTMTSIDTQIIAEDEQSFCKIGVDGDFEYYDIDEVVPLLRDFDSMTEIEKREYQYITERWMYDPNYSIADSIEWLNKRHFDYNGLIKNCLAMKAGKDVYDNQSQNQKIMSLDEHKATMSWLVNAACEWLRDNADTLLVCDKEKFINNFKNDLSSKL